MIVNKGERTYGKRHPKMFGCESSAAPLRFNFPKNKWRTNQRGDTVYGYQCYNQVNNGSKGFREKNGLDGWILRYSYGWRLEARSYGKENI